MAYRHIDQLYKNRDILMFKEVWASEKIHGTSGNVSFDVNTNTIDIFPGGESLERATAVIERISSKNILIERFRLINAKEYVVIYGEFYGGSQQHMSATYGKELKFVVFEVIIDGLWLNVPRAELVATGLGFEFVAYKQIPTTMEAIDAERDADSVQAIRNGMGPGLHREGVVLRPLIELMKNNGERIAAKHKREEFGETKTPKPVSVEKLEVLTKANEIADEWITENRMLHVLDKFPGADITQTGAIIKAMVEDVTREAAGEVVMSKEATAAISRKTAVMFKNRLKTVLYNQPK